MSIVFFSPLKKKVKDNLNSVNLRPFSSNQPKTTLNRKTSYNINEYIEKDSNSIRYYKVFKKNKMYETKNNFNKLYKKDLMGKERYTNFTIFTKREMSFKEKKSSKERTKQFEPKSSTKLLKQGGRILKGHPLYITDTFIKKKYKKNHKYMFYNPLKRNDISIPYSSDYNRDKDGDTDRDENTITNNHKFKNISFLKKMEREREKILNKTSVIDSDKNINLLNRKIDSISLSVNRDKSVYKYMIDLNYLIKKRYGNKLRKEKVKISLEENKSQNEYLDNKKDSLNKVNLLYDNYVVKFKEYISFLRRLFDKNDKQYYYLLNEVYTLHKDTLRIKMRINKLSEDKKIYNKFILLQICLHEKKIKLPEYYDYILSHTLEEGINYYKGVLSKKEVENIFDYKQKIIYKDYESYMYQIKRYENENREMIKKLDLLKKEIYKLKIISKELIEENKRLTLLFNDKINEKNKSKLEIINKYHFLCNEKNKLLRNIKINYITENMINKTMPQKKRYKLFFSPRFRDRDKDRDTSNKVTTNKSTNESFNIKENTLSNFNYLTPRTKHLSQQQLLMDYNIIYENQNNKNQHTMLYYTIMKIFLSLDNYMKKGDNMKRNEKITTENGLILKLLNKIEEAVNNIFEKEKYYSKKYNGEIIKIKIKMEKQRKLMGGQKQIFLRENYETIKQKLEKKNNKIFFLPKNRKRAISANITKRVIKKKKYNKLNTKKDFEAFFEDVIKG